MQLSKTYFTKANTDGSTESTPEVYVARFVLCAMDLLNNSHTHFNTLVRCQVEKNSRIQKYVNSNQIEWLSSLFDWTGQQEKRKEVKGYTTVIPWNSKTKLVKKKVKLQIVPNIQMAAKMCKDSVIQKKNQHCKIQIQPFLKVKNCKIFNLLSFDSS